MNRATLLFLLLVLLFCHGPTAFGRVAAGLRGRRDEELGRLERERARGGPGRKGEDLFLLRDSRQVVHTDSGSMRIVRSARGRIIEKPLHVGFITMEPHSLFIPQYTDSSLILFIRQGEAWVGSTHEDELVERQLKRGDIYRIPAGSAFYLMNAESGEKLRVICSIDTSESFELTSFQSFFIGGGTKPASILTGFDPETLAAAFNVTTEELEDILSRERDGPIVPIRGSEHYRLSHLKRMVTVSSEMTKQDADGDAGQMSWSWRMLLRRIFPLDKDNGRRSGGRKNGGQEEDTFNLFQKSPDFRNDYGWSVALDESEFKPLERSGIGIYLVNLSAGSMMAPHMNPTATEYGIILHGSGTIQIGYPNGSAAMNADVEEGDVFWIPRYFPFCQISSRSGTLEFFGFTTSSRKNRPQFLVGKSSVLQTLRGPELAASFGMSDRKMAKFLDAQREAVILPSPYTREPRNEDDDNPAIEEEAGEKSLGGGFAMDA